jgi:hypothetical protein
MTHDQRRIYMTSVALFFVALGIYALFRGDVWPGVLLVLIGAALLTLALGGPALRQRPVAAPSERWWHVLIYALISGVVAYVTGRLIHKSSSDAADFAAVFAGVGLLVRGWDIHRGRRRGVVDKPQNLPPYGAPPMG